MGFEGTWVSQFNGPQSPDSFTPGIDIFTRLGNIVSGEFYFSGRGWQGGWHVLGAGWSIFARAYHDETLLVGRYWTTPWLLFGPVTTGPINQFTNDPSGRCGELFFQLSRDGLNFMGGYNFAGEPDRWFAWDGYKVNHDPLYGAVLPEGRFPRVRPPLTVEPPELWPLV